MVLLLAPYQVLCYCCFAKPDPRTLVSQDRYWIVFVHRQNVILVLNLSFTWVFVCASWSLVTAWSHNLSSNLAFSDPKFWPSHHDTRKEKVATLGLLIQPLQWGKSPRHIVARTTVPVTRVSYTHHSIPFSTAFFHPHIPLQRLEIPDTVCTMNPRCAHTHAIHCSTNTGMYIWCPNLFPRHFLWNTNAPCNSLSLAPQCTAFT